jgi:sterol desaturase/sphingolipid hydroxylase (fatty acid hydroxylase superfamily)
MEIVLTFDFNNLVSLAPILSVAAFYFLERLFSMSHSGFRRQGSFVMVYCIGFALSFGVSTYLLVHFVMLMAPLQIFSFANWQVPMFVSFLASLLFLDFIYYIGHRIHHSVPFLWRLHRLHHSDTDVSALTTIFHHPLEYLSNLAILITAAVIFDVPVIVLVTYSLIHGLHSGFSHYKKPLPEALDKWLSYVVVTPSFHHVHHGLDMALGNSNFGAVLTLWDRLFRTAIVQRKKLIYGIPPAQAPSSESIRHYLSNPLK